jgi:ubiquinone/menaquinone biosynthesis C-methylase UbiE
VTVSFRGPMSILRRLTHAAVIVSVSAAAQSATAQLASRPAEEWTKTLEGPARVASLKIDEVVAALQMKPGQTLADIGAGPGLFEVALARAVGPSGRVFAVEIDAGFFPEIKKRTDEAGLRNVQTVLGKFTDPALPANVDMALFHDVLHHVEDRAGYLKTLARYLSPSGRIAVIDYEGSAGPHKGQPELQVTREQLATWMKAGGLTQVDDVKLFSDKFFVVYAKQ